MSVQCRALIIKIDRDISAVVSVSRRMWSVSAGARGVGDRPQLAGCAGARFATAAIAQLNPDSFVTNNGSHRDTDAPHMHALPARVCIAAV